MPIDWNTAHASLAGATCLWQDLDGLHHEPAPATVPLTSILWAWWNPPDDRVARLRIDAGRVYLAIATWSGDAESTIAWGHDDRRIAAFRSAGNATVTEQFDTMTIGDHSYLRPSALQPNATVRSGKRPS